jgi:phosphatidylinositol-3-phosphatase
MPAALAFGYDLNIPAFVLSPRRGSMKRIRYLLPSILMTVFLNGCTGQIGVTQPPSPSPNPGASNPQFGHVILVVEENANYSDVIGNPAMPYLNSLADAYGLATNYFANAHPSIPNYFELTTGQTLTVIDSLTPSLFEVNQDNVVRELVAAGKSWKSYAEDLPSVGYTGGDTGKYAVRHNPLAYMQDVQNDQAQAQNLVPFSQFMTDLTAGTLPQYSFIVPNLCDDGHDCPLSEADAWLKTNIDPLVNKDVFKKDGLLIIVFDEASDTDFTHGGGHIAAVVVSPFSKPGFKSGTLFQHQSVLRLMLDGLRVAKLPGDAATAPTMSEFFKAQ